MKLPQEERLIDMITNNLKKIAAGILLPNTTPNFFIPLINDAGVQVYYSMPYASNTNGRYYPAVGHINSAVRAETIPGIMVGTGSAQPTGNDYRLQSPILDNGSESNLITFSLDANNNPEATILVPFTNTSSDSVTIREIGYVENVRCSASSGGTSSSYHRILLDRTLLDAPLTVPAGGTATITYVLKGVWNQG